MQKFKTRLFITGIYRSGTTLISRILNNHSRLWVTYDSVHFMRFCYGKYNPIRKISKVKSLLGELSERISRRWGMKIDAGGIIGSIDRLENAGYGDIYDLIMDDLASQYKKDIAGWGEKTNVCWGQIPNFFKMFPRGKVIHVIRDPRDVMCSYRRMTCEPGFSYLDSAFCSLSSFSKINGYIQSFGPEQYYVLKYEELLKNPRQKIKGICDFLGLKFEDSMLDAEKFIAKDGGPWSGGSSFDKKLDGISQKPVNRWRKAATRLEIFFAELINRESMKRHGYELSGISVSRADWNKLYDMLNHNNVLKQRYLHWLKTGEGVEGYPSDPPIK